MPSPQIEGALTALEGRRLLGWCIDGSAPFAPVEVTLWIDGRNEGRCVADLVHGDGAVAVAGTGRYGFCLEIPRAYFDDGMHVLDVRPTDAGASLRGAPVRCRLPRAALVRGSLDDPVGMLVQGWAADDGDPEVPVRVRIEAGGETLATVAADRPRPDVERAGAGPETCGFRFRLPPRLIDEDEITIRAVADASGTQIGTHRLFRPRGSYERWARLNDAQRDGNRPDARRRSLEAVRRGGPLISVVMPVFDPDPGHLSAAIASVCGQCYPRWELCIADDASTDPRIRGLLVSSTSHDPRIRVAFRDEQGHICHASNTALGLAAGAFVALLDHDDILPSDALLHVAEACLAHPAATILYSDEDKLDADGERFDPYFKSAFNPDLLHAHNFISHLGVYRRDLVEAVGGFRPGYEGSQDYDLALRVLELAGAETVHHIPEVLYHWRVHAASTASANEVKPYAAAAMRRALEDHLARTGRAGRVEAHLGGAAMRLRHPLPPSLPPVSVVIPTGDRGPLLDACVGSLTAVTDYDPLELIVVDNGRGPFDWQSFVERAGGGVCIKVLAAPGPFNFSGLCNLAAQEAEGDVLVLLNDDTQIVDPDWLRELVSHALRPEVGAAGPKLVFPDGTIQHAGVALNVAGDAGHIYKHEPGDSLAWSGRIQLTQAVAAVTGACLAMRRELFLQAGGLDEDAFPVSYNDVDFCLRLEAMGFRNVYTPHTRLVHHEGASRGTDDNDPVKARRAASEREALRRRWSERIARDRFVNPNLSSRTERPELDFGRFGRD